MQGCLERLIIWVFERKPSVKMIQGGPESALGDENQFFPTKLINKVAESRQGFPQLVGTIGMDKSPAILADGLCTTRFNEPDRSIFLKRGKCGSRRRFTDFTN
jgi:hypothetical protein